MASMPEITVRVMDLELVRLFVWELRTLEDEMRVAASPFADRLGHALDRATAQVGDPVTTLDADDPPEDVPPDEPATVEEEDE